MRGGLGLRFELDTLHPTPCTEHLTPDTLHLTPDVLHRESNTVNLAPVPR